MVKLEATFNVLKAVSFSLPCSSPVIKYLSIRLPLKESSREFSKWVATPPKELIAALCVYLYVQIFKYANIKKIFWKITPSFTDSTTQAITPLW